MLNKNLDACIEIANEMKQGTHLPNKELAEKWVILDRTVRNIKRQLLTSSETQKQFYTPIRNMLNFNSQLEISGIYNISPYSDIIDGVQIGYDLSEKIKINIKECSSDFGPFLQIENITGKYNKWLTLEVEFEKIDWDIYNKIRVTPVCKIDDKTTVLSLGLTLRRQDLKNNKFFDSKTLYIPVQSRFISQAVVFEKSNFPKFTDTQNSEKYRNKILFFLPNNESGYNIDFYDFVIEGIE